jgi:hypothetical protein
MQHRSIPTRLAVLATTAALLISCSDDSGGGRPTDADIDAPSAKTPAGVVEATRLTNAADQAVLTPGVYAMGVASPDPDPPMVLIDVPAGYTGRGDGFEITGATERTGFRHLDTWTVDKVATEACGDVTWVDPGPSVEDLAEALTSLTVWETTEPVPVTIGGHEGVSMELSVPERLPARCFGSLAGFRDYLGGTQGIGPGKTQLLWIVDVDGQRMMLLVGYFPGAEGPRPKRVAEMVAMAEGAEFVDADRVAP